MLVKSKKFEEKKYDNTPSIIEGKVIKIANVKSNGRALQYATFYFQTPENEDKYLSILNTPELDLQLNTVYTIEAVIYELTSVGKDGRTYVNLKSKDVKVIG